MGCVHRDLEGYRKLGKEKNHVMGKLSNRARMPDWEAQQLLVGSGPRDPPQSIIPGHLSPRRPCDGLGRLQLRWGTAAQTRVKHRQGCGGWQAEGIGTSSSEFSSFVRFPGGNAHLSISVPKGARSAASGRAGGELGRWRPPSALRLGAGPRAGTVSLRAGAGLGRADLSPSTGPKWGELPGN